HAHVRMGVEIGHQGGEGVAENFGVGIEQEDVAPARPGQPQVIAGGEADVLRAGDQLDPGELGGDHFRAAVGGGAIDDDDLQGEIAASPVDGGEAGAQQVAHVPANDDDRE